MNEEIQTGRGMGMRTESGNSKFGGKMGWIVGVIVVVVIVVLGILFRDKLFGGSGDAGSGVSGKEGQYQAVFLSNGQVYFGKLDKADEHYAELSDIYYLQVTTPPLQGSQDQAQAQRQQPQIQLVKLGNELHGPEDKMFINRDQILFFEDLKDSGRVVQAIKEYQANPNRGQQQAPAGQQPAQQQAPVQQQQPVQQQAPAGN